MIKNYFLATIMLGLAACSSGRAPEPSLPEGVAASAYTFKDEAFLRGVNGSYNTSPAGRPAAILDVTYRIECVSDNGKRRFAQAKQILDKKYLVAPLYNNNSRERGWWRRGASKAVAQTGCIVTGLNDKVRTKDKTQTILWALRNRVPPAKHR